MIRLIVLGFLISNIISCSYSPKKFNEQMGSYISNEENIASLDEALETYRNKKAQKESELRAKADEEKIQEQLKNPVKIDIGSSPVKGNADAKVTIVEFSDFQCPFCGRGADVMEEIAQSYPNDVKFVYKFFPLPGHGLALPAAKAALAASQQGKFWQMYKLIFSNQRALKENSFDDFAKTLKLDMKKFKSDMSNPELEKVIEADVQLGSKLGVDGTPGFFVNGVSVVGAQPFEKFKVVIDKSLNRL